MQVSNKTKILIYPAGGENAVNIYNSLKYNLHFELFGATMSDNHSKYLYDSEHYYIGDLNIKNIDFLENFNSVLKKFNIDYILCTHDEVVKFLMQNEEKIEARICCSPLETTVIAENKFLTYKTFKDKYYFPKIYDENEKFKYPVFIKPFIGAGGKGTFVINNEQEYIKIKGNIGNSLICEYLPGREYTVDCFTNYKGKLIFANARTRERIQNGLPYRVNKVENNDDFREIAEDINKTLKFRGAWFFQLKEDKNGELKLMEVCVRQARFYDIFS